MRFHLGHPDFPQYAFNLLATTPATEKAVNRLAPVETVSRAYDWPHSFKGFRGWTDTVNSLWWPRGAEQFATCVVLITDEQNDKLKDCIAGQKNQIVDSSTWRWPHLVLSSRLSPPDAGLPADAFGPGGLGPVAVETELIAWKMYPLAPINVSSLSPAEAVRGAWLLPLVDIRYFYRNTPLNSPGGSSASSTAAGGAWPIIEIDRTDATPGWMPPLRAFPQDLSGPLHYEPIRGVGMESCVNAAHLFGEAADKQALMLGWRVVNRDVRSLYNRPDGFLPHDKFTGVVADYPPNWSLPVELVNGYHLDVIAYHTSHLCREAGGECDVRTLDDLTARKVQVLFPITGTEAMYCVVIRAVTEYPDTVLNLAEDANGPDAVEKTLIPTIHLNVQVSGRTPPVAEHATLVEAAKQRVLLYYHWRRKQFYGKFPGIFPLIPNGHAAMIRWDFQTTCCETTYIALEGVQGTEDACVCCGIREGFYARIDGEGALQDNLHGVYAFTELRDHDGVLSDDHPTPRRGYVAGVNNAFNTVNPARDENGKVAVPVGATVFLRPGTPYLDVKVDQIFDHYLFTTSDLMQVIKLKPNFERNDFGHVGAVIQRWNPDIKGFVDSKDIWAVVLG